MHWWQIVATPNAVHKAKFHRIPRSLISPLPTVENHTPKETLVDTR